MNPEIIEKELLVIGLETTSREGSVADDVHAEGELAGKLNLPATIPNQIDKGKHLVLLWNFQPENDFQAMTAVAVTAVKVLPSVCRAYRFPMSECGIPDCWPDAESRRTLAGNSCLVSEGQGYQHHRDPEIQRRAAHG